VTLLRRRRRIRVVHEMNWTRNQGAANMAAADVTEIRLAVIFTTMYVLVVLLVFRVILEIVLGKSVSLITHLDNIAQSRYEKKRDQLTPSELLGIFVAWCVSRKLFAHLTSTDVVKNAIELLSNSQDLDQIERHQESRVLSIHPEQKSLPNYPRGHIHFIHDCNKNRGSCRCDWINEAGPVRFAKGNV
jgi:hypothetical protein